MQTEECDWSNLSISDNFGILIPFSATFFPEMSAHVSLKVATNNSFRDKENMKT